MDLARSAGIPAIPADIPQDKETMREIQLGGAQKKKKTNRTPITQQDVETVTLLVQGSWSDTEITDSWIQTMNAWWRKLRGN